MSVFHPPVRDIRFVRNELFDFPALYQTMPDCSDATQDTLDAILDELARFCAEELVPLYRVGDTEGCTWSADGVKTPTGFKEAYAKFVEGGWPSLSAPLAVGGQGLPESMGILMNELLGQANWAWAMYPGLSHGAKHTLQAHGTAEQQRIYLSKLVSGHWSGTMCLTEPHCGSDLGLLKTRAEMQSDGTYKITGTKIFISAGEHDMSENIVHIVLARLPDAPAGTKGISLFIVPKFLPDANDEKGERNLVTCGSLEHKMGIHGNATCVMNFDGATGFLIGEPNRGLNCMFTFMNAARIGTAIQGIAHAERGFQGALAYAKERLQMRSLSGPKNPQGVADPIIVHPDVRRLLLTAKAFAEGGRMLVHYLARELDLVQHGTDKAARDLAENRLALLTPIAKAFITETGFEAANCGMQVFGGHGYIAEWGMEQNVRDSRISMLYEGTTGIQSLDLIARKVLQNGGINLNIFLDEIDSFCAENPAHNEFTGPLSELSKEWRTLTTELTSLAMQNMDEVGAAAVDYLMYAGYITQAWLWARAAILASGKGDADGGFYQAKLHTARFYFHRLLPRTRAHLGSLRAGSYSLMAMPESQFFF
ncbi:MAG TPA: acyl-CoA dehydrogenase C-terminal domain-containing protein [Pseudomonadales bacterium]|nr:acyl-CoA dehydrogenase C-terminal domain-containing protein [Pseudomonadales bacterium]